MADRCVESLQPEIGRELRLVKGKSSRYRGYKKDILIENLSERENTVFMCIRCQGIMREVCLSSGGEQFCSSCKKEGEQANPNLQMDKMILSFKCSCPLIARGCKWLGALGGCEEHLDTCGYVLETCILRCGVVLQRDELKIHEKESCPQRIVKCKKLEESAKQKEKISEQGAMIETMFLKMISLEEEVEILTKLAKATKLNWRITKVPENEYSNFYEQFQVAGYNFKFHFYNYFSDLQIVVCPQSGSNYDKLKWPFKAEFVTHLSSQSDPGNIKKFKSELLIWKREYFDSDSYLDFTIATFSRNEFLKHFINSEAEFEIFVILL